MLTGRFARKQPCPVRAVVDPFPLRAAKRMNSVCIQIDEQQIFVAFISHSAWKKLLVYRKMRPLKISIVLHLPQHIPAGKFIAVSGMNNLQLAFAKGVAFRMYVNRQELVFQHIGGVDACGRLIFDDEQLGAVAMNGLREALIADGQSKFTAGNELVYKMGDILLFVSVGIDR
ncbi:hypothetical protein D3C75_655280 [compost metagenome]